MIGMVVINFSHFSLSLLFLSSILFERMYKFCGKCKLNTKNTLSGFEINWNFEKAMDLIWKFKQDRTENPNSDIYL